MGAHTSLASYTRVFVLRQEVALKWRELAVTWDAPKCPGAPVSMVSVPTHRKCNSYTFARSSFLPAARVDPHPKLYEFTSGLGD